MITPVFLSGGSGTRLWPLSRKSYPKQFVPLVGDETLFQGSAKRLSGPGYAPPLVLTNGDFRFIVTEQLHEIGHDPGAILIEPEGRNTAPAVLANMAAPNGVCGARSISGLMRKHWRSALSRSPGWDQG